MCEPNILHLFVVILEPNYSHLFVYLPDKLIIAKILQNCRKNGYYEAGKKYCAELCEMPFTGYIVTMVVVCLLVHCVQRIMMKVPIWLSSLIGALSLLLFLLAPKYIYIYVTVCFLIMPLYIITGSKLVCLYNYFVFSYSFN